MRTQAIRIRSTERTDLEAIPVDGEARVSFDERREYEDAGPSSLPPVPACMNVHRSVLVGTRRIFGMSPAYSVFEVTREKLGFEARLPGVPHAGHGKSAPEAINNFVDWFEVQHNVLISKQIVRADMHHLTKAIEGTVAWYRDPAQHEPPQVTEFLGQVAAAGAEDAAIDLVVFKLDQLVDERAVEQVDQILNFLDPSEFPTEVSLGALTATHRASGSLRTRKRFYERTASALTARHGVAYAEELLAGLE